MYQVSSTAVPNHPFEIDAFDTIARMTGGFSSRGASAAVINARIESGPRRYSSEVEVCLHPIVSAVSAFSTARDGEELYWGLPLGTSLPR